MSNVLVNKKKEQSSFAEEEKQKNTATAISLPKRVQRLSGVKVRGEQ